MSNQEVPTTENGAVVAQPGAQVAPEKATTKKGSGPKKGAPKGHKRVKAAKAAVKPTRAPKPQRHPKPTTDQPVERPGTAKAKVITMLRRKGGASLTEIRKATEWQAHTVRGFISLLGSKSAYVITSSKTEDGSRVYAIQVK